MKQDGLGCLYSEQGDFPANIGDSCAETCRAIHLKNCLLQVGVYSNVSETLRFHQFITQSGFIRHPHAPPEWREQDFSSDQALPLFLAALSSDPNIDTSNIVRNPIKFNGYRTGNGNLVTPMLFALLIDSKFLLNIAVLGQMLLFLLPFRWSDSKKKFESSKDSSGDYLNFFHAAIYTSSWVRKLIPKKRVLEKVMHYYKDEPNSQWILDLYSLALENLL